MRKTHRKPTCYTWSDILFYAFFSNKTRKPLKLNSKSEKLERQPAAEHRFWQWNGVFWCRKAVWAGFTEYFFPTLMIFMRFTRIGGKKMHNPVARKKIKVNYCKNALTNYVMWCIVLSKSKIITIKINIKFFTII